MSELWNVRGVGQAARAKAKKAAEACGVTVGMWIERAIEQTAEEDRRNHENAKISGKTGKPKLATEVDSRQAIEPLELPDVPQLIVDAVVESLAVGSPEPAEPGTEIPATMSDYRDFIPPATISDYRDQGAPPIASPDGAVMWGKGECLECHVPVFEQNTDRGIVLVNEDGTAHICGDQPLRNELRSHSSIPPPMTHTEPKPANGVAEIPPEHMRGSRTGNPQPRRVISSGFQTFIPPAPRTPSLDKPSGQAKAAAKPNPPLVDERQATKLRCIHGTKKGFNCWQCGGLAAVKK